MGLILAGFALIVLFDFMPILRRHSLRTALAFLLFFIPALTISLLLANHIHVPSIMKLAGKALTALGITY